MQSEQWAEDVNLEDDASDASELFESIQFGEDFDWEDSNLDEDEVGEGLKAVDYAYDMKRLAEEREAPPMAVRQANNLFLDKYTFDEFEEKLSRDRKFATRANLRLYWDYVLDGLESGVLNVTDGMIRLATFWKT